MENGADSSAIVKPLLVLPTFNEVGTIAEVIDRAFAAVPALTIVVVDDGSTDGTTGVVELLAADGAKDVHLLKRTEKLGLGDAYRTGFSWGLERGFDGLIEMDADLQHDPSVLANVVRELGRSADLVIGSRYVAGGQIAAWSVGRRAISRVGNIAAKVVLGLPISDSTSGFRGYTSELLTAIPLSEVRSNGYGFQVEMAFLCHQVGAEVLEVPINFEDRESGESKMTLSIAIEAVLLLARLSLRRVKRY